MHTFACDMMALFPWFGPDLFIYLSIYLFIFLFIYDYFYITNLDDVGRAYCFGRPSLRHTFLVRLISKEPLELGCS